MSAVTALRNARWERIEWACDLAGYLILALTGAGAVFLPSDFLRDHIRSEPVLWCWGVALLAGGLAGALGRILARWWIEQLANVVATMGAIIYLVVVVAGSLGSKVEISIVFVGLITFAIVACFRRYAGLQQETYVPTLDTWRAQLVYIFTRRTPLVPPRTGR